MPSDPVFATMFGVPMSGWPGRPFSLRSVWMLSNGRRPSPISTAYSAGTSWPFELKQRSSGASGPSGCRSSSRWSHATMSMLLKVVPRCPDPAFPIM